MAFSFMPKHVLGSEPSRDGPNGFEDDMAPEPSQISVLDSEIDGDNCSICLQTVVDRTVIPTCSHEFCFDCILIWTEQSRKCPLCSQGIGSYLMHHIRSNFDYQKHHLTPLRSSSPPLQNFDARPRQAARRLRREREWGRAVRRETEDAGELERAVDKRRWVYQHGLYAKHVASNIYTRYRPFPTPAQFAASPDLITRATIFIRRELLIWVNLDVEFLTTFILSLMRSIDIKSESAVKLMAEFLDMDTPYAAGERYKNTEHFVHELYSYLRSPYRDLTAYDSVVQYDVPEGLDPPRQREVSSRWYSTDRHSRSPHEAYAHPRTTSSEAIVASAGPSSSRNGKDERTAETTRRIAQHPVAPEPRGVETKYARVNALQKYHLEPSHHTSGTIETSSQRDLKGKRREYLPENVASTSRDPAIGQPPIVAELPRGVDRDAGLGEYTHATSPITPEWTTSSMQLENHEIPPPVLEVLSETNKFTKIKRNRDVLSSVRSHLLKANGEREISSARVSVFPPMSRTASDRPSLLARISDAETFLSTSPSADYVNETANTTLDTLDDRPVAENPDGLSQDNHCVLASLDKPATVFAESTDNRAKLLQKLQDEKLRVTAHTAGAKGENSQRGYSQVLETQLRSQARLRVKLAAERRSAQMRTGKSDAQ